MRLTILLLAVLCTISAVFGSAGGGLNYKRTTSQSLSSLGPVTWASEWNSGSALITPLQVSGVYQRFSVASNAHLSVYLTVTYTMSCSALSAGGAYVYDVTAGAYVGTLTLNFVSGGAANTLSTVFQVDALAGHVYEIRAGPCVSGPLVIQNASIDVGAFSSA
jgi:hypothetical protein